MPIAASVSFLSNLECGNCGTRHEADRLQNLCAKCAKPLLARYDLERAKERVTRATFERGEDTLWRFRDLLPVRDAARYVATLGEGMTPLLRYGTFLVKDESGNPTGSFKARGLAAAVTRAVQAGVRRLVVPTAGNAGVALAAYATRAGVAARVYAPASTPPTILTQIRSFGAELVLVEGHIGDCGKAARAYAADTGAMDVSTLREPYRIEGKKSLGLELAEQLGWTLPDVIVYPTGGGTGLIGMWKAFGELAAAGWVRGPLPRMYSVQSAGCAPVVQAFRAGAAACTPWPEPRTIAAGLQVPSPLGDRLMLAALRQSGGDAVTVTDAQLVAAAQQLQTLEGIDASPEGGATLAGALELKARGVVTAEQRIVLFNTGAGWLYRG